MKKIIVFPIVIGLLFISACDEKETPEEIKTYEPIMLTSAQMQKVELDNKFSFQMFKEVSNIGEENIFFSPLSLNIALGMLYNGTDGDTRTELADVMGLGSFTEGEVNEYYQKIIQSLLNADKLTDINIANSIWYRDGFVVKQPFIDLNNKYFDAEVRAIDFSKGDAVDIINNWCADKTNNKIDEIIDGPIQSNVIMYLINALYFKSQWKYQFKEADTRDDIFTKSNGETVDVKMMVQESVTLPFYQDDSFLCAEIPYGNEAFSMVVILPSVESNINQLIDYIDETKLNNIYKHMYEIDILLALPRFKAECDINLNDPLKDAGIKKIFAGGLDNIADADLVVSNVKQKTFIEVNEKGTEAAAVTAVEIVESAPMPTSFYANRPFLYMIKEKSTGAILFIGRMDNPQE